MEHFGIEALSRGAEKATFCDNSKDAIKIIKQNLEETRLTKKSNVINSDYMQALKILADKKEKFDVIFLDPPYKTDFTIKAINKIIEQNLLTENGIIVVETNDKNKQEEILKNTNIEIYDERKYGIAFIIFIRKG